MSNEPGPRPRGQRYSYDESLDEPAKLIENEPCEIEEETPAIANEPVEQVDQDKSSLGAFEE